MLGKSALDLICDYGGDSSDDEVPGCRVSTKRGFKDEPENNSKRIQRLPIPTFTVNNVEDKMHENASLHEGRLRSFPHEQGNWASYVYIPFESNNGINNLLESVIKICDGIDLKPMNNFHVSLTQTVILRHHWIDSFVNTVKDNLLYVTKFLIIFDCLNVYINEERTRTFISLQIKTGYDSLLKIVDIMDRCLKEYNLPLFYEDKSFHMSIAWCVGDFVDQISPKLPQLNKRLQDTMNEFPQDNWYIYVEQLLCKIGNKFFHFHLT